MVVVIVCGGGCMLWYIYIYTDAPAVLLVHVGLAQARPNNTNIYILAVQAKYYV